MLNPRRTTMRNRKTESRKSYIHKIRQWRAQEIRFWKPLLHRSLYFEIRLYALEALAHADYGYSCARTAFNVYHPEFNTYFPHWLIKNKAIIPEGIFTYHMVREIVWRYQRDKKAPIRRPCIKNGPLNTWDHAYCQPRTCDWCKSKEYFPLPNQRPRQSTRSISPR